jgi:hypothetical protein
VFIHIGNNISVLSDEIIGIFDMEVATTMKDSRRFLKMCEEEDFIENVLPEEMPKTVVVTEKDGRSKVYLSPISAATVKKRFNMSY